MKAYTEKRIEEVMADLAVLDRQYNPQQLTDRRLGVIAAAIDSLKEKLKSFIFTSPEEEVHFFKNVLPPLLALHIYYSDKIEWDRISWQSSAETQFAFIDRIYSQAEMFRKENQLFWEYYRDEKSDLDHLFFLRNSPVNREARYELRRIVDPSSPPLHSEILAKLTAYARLEQEVKSTIAENKSGTHILRPAKIRLRWTGKQIDLIELGYALYVTGCFNHGKAELKDIFEFFAEVFEFDPGNSSRLFQDILRRKTGYTNYLDSMKQKLLQRIDEIEMENSNRR